MTLSLCALALVALGGWYLWNSIVVEALGSRHLDSPGFLAALGFLAGAGAFFAPCAVSLFPGYITYYMAVTRPANPRQEVRLWRSLRYGGSAAMGAITFFALIGIALHLVGGGVSSFLITAKPLVALTIIGLGILQLTDWTIQLPGRKMLAGESNPVRTLFLYGFGYGLASAGCTLPVYVFMIILPLSSGQPGAALITFLSFALAMGLLMVTVS
ncbi:MAG: cytochrome c biogenesis CcdA family protein, partial [Candidatus Methylomirabilis sp.]